jgi:hypothetical protein
LFRWTQTLPGKQVALGSVRRDVEVFLRTYVTSRQSRGKFAEDSLDCPLVELRLIEQPVDSQTYEFRRGAQRRLSDGILLFAILQFWEAFLPASETLSLYDIARHPGSPGRMFKISESSLVERLEAIEPLTDGALSYGETAGLRQLYRRRKLNPIDVLKKVYSRGHRR